jgi:hypothetical protein
MYEESLHEYLNPDYLSNLNVHELFRRKNPVLKAFVMSIAKCNKNDYKKQNCLNGAIESIYKARN